MPTPHNSAEVGDIAERILLPGDPLRAKYIAENFLTDAKEYSHVRNVLGYTGSYKGTPVSVQGTGMGMPSIAIYVHELINVYGVKKLIRVGSCGALAKDLHIRDVVIAQGTTTDSSMPKNIFGTSVNFAPLADFSLLENAVHHAREKHLPVRVGNVLSQDRFYDDEIDFAKLLSYGVLAAEMETAALYLIAAKFDVQALGIFTVSDHITCDEARATPEERERSFNDMIELALESILKE
ncbi:purine-nucleoside phosphorylase [Selenomonas sp. CM52]|uniref:purine-nucleoside phosphorylase n=1 Tax=Selenomonas sp. CM52 TaxID=936381 RepID=UPI00027C573B|nr:purine-nucleoside phosphorylase [Selenomonas sp. CM52]EJU28790.1 purine nucleoside phosphorylase [Selenomonas sp. CM52]